MKLLLLVLLGIAAITGGAALLTVPMQALAGGHERPAGD
jgi:hypothetical protein